MRSTSATLSAAPTSARRGASVSISDSTPASDEWLTADLADRPDRALLHQGEALVEGEGLAVDEVLAGDADAGLAAIHLDRTERHLDLVAAHLRERGAQRPLFLPGEAGLDRPEEVDVARL